jgi:hypothetical protein
MAERRSPPARLGAGGRVDPDDGLDALAWGQSASAECADAVPAASDRPAPRRARVGRRGRRPVVRRPAGVSPPCGMTR